MPGFRSLPALDHEASQTIATLQNLDVSYDVATSASVAMAKVASDGGSRRLAPSTASYGVQSTQGLMPMSSTQAEHEFVSSPAVNGLN
jgi:hypothetical protein